MLSMKYKTLSHHAAQSGALNLLAAGTREVAGTTSKRRGKPAWQQHAPASKPQKQTLQRQPLASRQMPPLTQAQARRPEMHRIGLPPIETQNHAQLNQRAKSKTPGDL